MTIRKRRWNAFWWMTGTEAEHMTQPGDQDPKYQQGYRMQGEAAHVYPVVASPDEVGEMKPQMDRTRQSTLQTQQPDKNAQQSSEPEQERQQTDQQRYAEQEERLRREYELRLRQQQERVRERAQAQQQEQQARIQQEVNRMQAG